MQKGYKILEIWKGPDRSKHQILKVFDNIVAKHIDLYNQVFINIDIISLKVL